MGWVFFFALVAMEVPPHCYAIIQHCRLLANVFRNLVLTENEYMGPNWTHAEGFILGVGAKMFTIAGPVIVYGVSASVMYGVIYWIFTMFCV